MSVSCPLPWRLVPNGDTDIVVDADGNALGELRPEASAKLAVIMEVLIDLKVIPEASLDKAPPDVAEKAPADLQVS